MIGIESIGSDFEFRYDIVSHYYLDYLFGGTTALATAIAAANAAITASNQVKLAAQAAAGKKRKRRRQGWLINYFCLYKITNNFLNTKIIFV